MKVLVVGSGGREHALCWKLSQSPMVEKIYCVPGNGGIEEIAQCVDLEYEKSFSELVRLIKKEKIGYTLVGPEAPVVAGMVDYFRKRELKIFGPSKKAARIEGSKVFAKRFMKKYQIPTADFAIFSDSVKAIEYIEKQSKLQVIKVDGLAGGKGALVCGTKREAVKAVKEILEEKAFGDAGKRIVVEERLRGKEISFFVLTDGTAVKALVSSQDHKPIFDYDNGPNTGGMGAYSPAPLSPSLFRKIMGRIIRPTLWGLKEEDSPYRGVLYLGLMIEAGEPKVLEFNVRFGDPETQVTLPRLKNDLLKVLLSVSEGSLERIKLEWRRQVTTCVILSSAGYPGKYETGKTIEGLSQLSHMKSVFPFWAGVKRENGNLITSGGRVLGITASADTIKESIRQAYRGGSKVHFEGKHYRHDIGYQALK